MKYSVRLTRKVTDLLQAWVSVEADSKEQAEEMALEKDDIDFDDFVQEVEADAPEVDSSSTKEEPDEET